MSAREHEHELEQELAKQRQEHVNWSESQLAHCSPAERKVLDAMAAIPLAALRRWVARGFATVLDLARAELARRGLDLDPNCPDCGHHLVRFSGPDVCGWCCVKCDERR